MLIEPPKKPRFTGYRGTLGVLQKHGRGSVFVIFTENGHSGCAENVVMVVNFRLGRLKNTAPVHKSKFRKRFEFILVRGAFWSAFGSPFGSLWDPLGSHWGHFGVPWDPFGSFFGHLGATWAPLWRPWAAFGCLWSSI